jgi:hypothetical protein
MPCGKFAGHREPVWVMVCLIGLSKISPLHRFHMQCQLPKLKYIRDRTGRFAANERLVHGCTVTCFSPFDPPNANLRVRSVPAVPPDFDGLRHCVRCRSVSTWQPIMGFAAFHVRASRELGTFQLGFPERCRVHGMISHSPTALYPSKLFPQH